MIKERRNTCQRRIILEELSAVKSHPTADEIYALVRGRLPRISLGTVYRNLQILAGEGQVRVLNDLEGRKRYDADLREHCHARCLRCGRVTDLENPPQTGLTSLPEAPEGFRLLGCRIEYVGLCLRCAEDTEKAFPARGAGSEYIPFERRQTRSGSTLT